MARKLVAADGRTWTVGRRWLPWAPRAVRLARKGELPRASPWRILDGLDVASLFDDGPVGVLIALVVVVACLAVAIPLVIVFGELLLLALLLPVWVVARVLLRQPWIVIAQSKHPTPQVLARRVVGWKSSSNAIDEMVAQLSVGDSTAFTTLGSR